MSVAAIVIGIVLFGFTLYYIDLDETIASARRLGLALPVILLPGACWHVLRTWGWAMASARPTASVRRASASRRGAAPLRSNG